MMIKSFLIIRFYKKKTLNTISRQHQMNNGYLSHSHQFSAKLHNACGHDIKRHVTGVYEDLRDDIQEIKLQTIYGPI